MFYLDIFNGDHCLVPQIFTSVNWPDVQMTISKTTSLKNLLTCINIQIYIQTMIPYFLYMYFHLLQIMTMTMFHTFSTVMT